MPRRPNRRPFRIVVACLHGRGLSRDVSEALIQSLSRESVSLTPPFKKSYSFVTQRKKMPYSVAVRGFLPLTSIPEKNETHKLQPSDLAKADLFIGTSSPDVLRTLGRRDLIEPTSSLESSSRVISIVSASHDPHALKERILRMISEHR